MAYLITWFIGTHQMMQYKTSVNDVCKLLLVHKNASIFRIYPVQGRWLDPDITLTRVIVQCMEPK